MIGLFVLVLNVHHINIPSHLCIHIKNVRIVNMSKEFNQYFVIGDRGFSCFPEVIEPVEVVSYYFDK